MQRRTILKGGAALETLAEVKSSGHATTLFGRKCWFPRINASNPNERMGSERAAINAPIQGTSADIIKRAMVRMGPALAEAASASSPKNLPIQTELTELFNDWSMLTPRDGSANANNVLATGPTVKSR